MSAEALAKEDVLCRRTGRLWASKMCRNRSLGTRAKNHPAPTLRILKPSEILLPDGVVVIIVLRVLWLGSKGWICSPKLPESGHISVPISPLLGSWRVWE